MFEKFLNLIFPNVCGFCNEIDKNSLCKNCELSLEKYEINCIKDYTKDNQKYFDYQYSALKYENIVREKIIKYKFNENSYLYKTFAKIIIKNKKVYGFLKLYDIIIPVPMHKLKKSVRGYNQSELLAKEIAKQMELHFEKELLIKIKNTKVQSTLTKTQRAENVKNAFFVADTTKVKGKKIILIDDIYTTGSTVNECSKVLKKAGAKEICVVTIAKD
ncbi:MAG: ComF family protein [Clostridia bacterium]|nr:ComF family protein [Clostridia bacterium]